MSTGFQWSAAGISVAALLMTIWIPGLNSGEPTAMRLAPPHSAESAPSLREEISAALRDPFFIGTVQTGPPEIPAPAHQAPVVVAQPVEAPPLGLRVYGAMTSPDGSRAIFATSSDGEVVLVQGRALPNGYIVKSISERSVEFVYPALGVTATLQIPPEPRQEIR